MIFVKKNIKLIAVLAVFILFCFVPEWDEKLLLPMDLPDMDIEYKEQPDPFNTFSGKIWLHGVNDYERLEDLDDYKGMEIDVHYSSLRGEFYVTHDPNPEKYLPLDSLLASVDAIDNYYIWLDFKNLNEYNHQQALQRLTSLCRDFQIKPGNIIVESMKPFYLSAFTSQGYNTSYYLPPFNPYDASDEEIIGYVDSITLNLDKSNVTFISGDYKQYHFIKEYFPDSEILLWQHHRNLLAPYLRQKILDDPEVKVLLVN